METVFPNPLGPGKLVVIVDSNSQGKWKIPDSRLWANGLYDFAVFDSNGISRDVRKYNFMRPYQHIMQ